MFFDFWVYASIMLIWKSSQGVNKGVSWYRLGSQVWYWIGADSDCPILTTLKHIIQPWNQSSKNCAFDFCDDRVEQRQAINNPSTTLRKPRRKNIFSRSLSHKICFRAFRQRTHKRDKLEKLIFFFTYFWVWNSVHPMSSVFCRAWIRESADSVNCSRLKLDDKEIFSTLHSRCSNSTADNPHKLCLLEKRPKRWEGCKSLMEEEKSWQKSHSQKKKKLTKFMCSLLSNSHHSNHSRQSQHDIYASSCY